MSLLSRVLTFADRVAAPRPIHAHCDLPCGVYNPLQARIEAESVKACMEKFHGSDDPEFKLRSIVIKEERADLVKHHLWVLWTDYFKPEHLAKVPELHDLFWRATKKAGETKKSTDPAVGQQLIDLCDEVGKAFQATKS